MLEIPHLSKCFERDVKPKAHPFSGSPEEWLSNKTLQLNSLTGITFDFFIDWSKVPNEVKNEIWIKRIIKKGFTYHELITKLNDTITNEFGEDYLISLITFTNKYNLNVKILIFNDDCDWTDESNQIMTVSPFILNNEISFEFEMTELKKIKNQIKKYSGGAVRIGNKGLSYGTSNLECYLSKTDSLYPGDVDLIILDANSDPICMLEFKKHTLDTPISNQKLSNYYPIPDGRKYKRLALLKDFLSAATSDLPLLVLYYPTNPRIIEGKLELLQGQAESLSSKAASLFLLPQKNDITTYKPVLNKILKAVEYHNKTRN